jgi:GntR family transcriptional regulator
MIPGTFQRTGGEPLHAQAESRLRQLIATPAHQDGALLPDEVTLARDWGISRATIRAAFARLVDAGLLERQRGVGTRVVRRPISHRAGAWSSFAREMEAQGIVVRLLSVALERLDAPATVAEDLGLAVGTPCWRLLRLRGDAAGPIVRMASWFAPRIPLGPEDDLRRPLYDLLGSRGIHPSRSRESIRALAADTTLAGALAVPPGKPVLHRHRVVLDAEEQPFEVADNHYRCDRFTLDLDLRSEGTAT